MHVLLARVSVLHNLVPIGTVVCVCGYQLRERKYLFVLLQIFQSIHLFLDFVFFYVLVIEGC